MAQKAEAKVQSAITALVDDVDKSFLRNKQYEMHTCASKCCLDKTLSVQQVNECISDCSVPLKTGQTIFQRELEDFQSRLQRCVMVCQDDIKDRVATDTTEAQVNIFKADFEVCAMKCVDQHISNLPNIRRRIQDSFNKLG